MRCPQCGFLSFENATSCRNCGHDFTVTGDATDPPDIDLRPTSDPPGPFDDLVFEPDVLEKPIHDGSPGEIGSPADLPDLADPDRALRTPDLPLFGSSRRAGRETEALAQAAPPRAPLAVRRPTPDVRRPGPRTAHERGPADEPPGRARPDRTDGPDVGSLKGSASHARRPQGNLPLPARPAERLAAALVDLVLLGGIDTAVVYLTLRIAGLEPAEAGRLPVVPLVMFLVMLNGGYMAAFTAASGQTIGKMMAGIRVVTGAGRGVTFGQAVGRSGGVILSLATLGAGFLPAFGAGGRRTLHDWLADTRVVRV